MIKFVRSDHFGTWYVPIASTLAVQIGDVLAKITSGANSGLYGPHDTSASDGRQTVANIIGVAVDRVSVYDATGFQERVLPNQQDNVCTYITHCAACDGNEAFYYASGPVRAAINAESGLATKNQLAGTGFSFIN